MGQHSIYIDEEVWAELQKRGVALKDNPNSVLRRVLLEGIEGRFRPVADATGRHVVRIDEEVSAELQKRGAALKDSPNSVLRRVLLERLGPLEPRGPDEEAM